MSEQRQTGGPAHHRGASCAPWAVTARILHDLRSANQASRAADGAFVSNEVRAEALAGQASPMLDESDFQLLLGEFLDVRESGGSPAVRPASFSVPGAPALPTSPFGAEPLPAIALERSHHGCGVATPSQPPQLSTADSACQTAPAVPVVLVRPASASDQALASLPEPATLFTEGTAPARTRLVRRVSHEGSNEVSVTTVEVALHSDASRPSTPTTVRRAERNWEGKSPLAAQPHSRSVPVKLEATESAPSSSRSSLKRRVQNREAQQRRRLRLKVCLSHDYDPMIGPTLTFMQITLTLSQTLIMW
jgi:hypothetical protein